MSDIPFAAGQRIGPYLLQEEVGQGAMAIVFRAVKQGAMGFRKQVALKVVLPEHARDRTYIESLIDEARLCGFLNHQNLAQVFEFECYDGIYCMAMEFVVGPTLRQLLRSPVARHLTVGQALRIAIEVCNGLYYAHTALDEDGNALNIVHRDLKPSNVMLTGRGEVKIVDFGLARADTARATSKTATGVIKGTPLYMSPEQVLSQPLTHQSDLFSLCTILAEMILLERVFTAPSVFEIISAIATCQVDEPLRKLEKAHPGIAEVLRKGWSLTPAERHADARALARDLENQCRLADETPIAELVNHYSEIHATADDGDIEIPSMKRVSGVDTLCSGKHPGKAVRSVRVARKLSKKVCMLGGFGVGKTSLVARYVHSMFSEKYKTTVGVKIDKKTVRVDDVELTMVLWDLHGDDRIRKLRASHLKGAAGYILVVDGTRMASLTTALEMVQRLKDEVEGLPFVVAVNKSDLRRDWELGEAELADLTDRGMKVHLTSALDGSGVEDMFEDLSRTLVR